LRYGAEDERRFTARSSTLVDMPTFLVTDGFSVFRFFRSPLSRAGEDDLSLENNRHRLNLDGRSSECPGT